MAGMAGMGGGGRPTAATLEPDRLDAVASAPFPHTSTTSTFIQDFRSDVSTTLFVMRDARLFVCMRGG